MSETLKSAAAGLAEGAGVIIGWKAMNWITGWQLPPTALGITVGLDALIQTHILRSERTIVIRLRSDNP